MRVQLSKLDTSGQGLVLDWVSGGFDAERADLQGSELLPRLGAWVAGELSSGRVLKQSSELEQDITARHREMRPTRPITQGSSDAVNRRKALRPRPCEGFGFDRVNVVSDCTWWEFHKRP